MIHEFVGEIVITCAGIEYMYLLMYVNFFYDIFSTFWKRKKKKIIKIYLISFTTALVMLEYLLFYVLCFYCFRPPLLKYIPGIVSKFPRWVKFYYWNFSLEVNWIFNNMSKFIWIYTSKYYTMWWIEMNHWMKMFSRLKFVVDHIAKPYIKDKKIDGWKEEIAAIAKYPNVYCKL